ncbi:hypothetical protein ACOME3_009492 [Neoechinorhynchus agilis]
MRLDVLGFPFFHLVIAIVVAAAVMIAHAEVTILDGSNVTVDEFLSLSAEFGPSISAEGIFGWSALAQPLNACTNIQNYSSNDGPCIVLIERSRELLNCTFDQKVKRAQDAGFSAVIVFNYNDGTDQDDLITMRSSGLINPSTIKIPSTFVSSRSGQNIMKYVAASRIRYKIWIRRETDDFIYKEIKFYLVPFVCVLVLTLMFLCSITWRYIARWRRELARRLPRSVLKTIPVKRFCKADNDTYDDTCAICLDDYFDGVKIRILSCGHGTL